MTTTEPRILVRIEEREPNASVAQVLPGYRTLSRLEMQLAAARSSFVY